MIVAEGNFVIGHGRFSGFGAPASWIAADILVIEEGVLVEHWDVIQTKQPVPNPRAEIRCSAVHFPG
jgi:predicted SnoaL-like aldol condensation-catalyzing enzyme